MASLHGGTASWIFCQKLAESQAYRGSGLVKSEYEVLT